MSQFEKQSEAAREWLAFRYIAGELSGEELAVFEAELETSQVARESVAFAVEMSQAIAIAESREVELVETVSRGSRLSWIFGIGWIGAGAAAASIAGAVWWNVQGSNTRTSELAKNWTETLTAEPSPPALEEPSEAGPVLDVEAEVAPSWMTAGVISLSGGKVEDDDEMMEN